jgi:hypothetical protein
MNMDVIMSEYWRRSGTTAYREMNSFSAYGSSEICCRKTITLSTIIVSVTRGRVLLG